MSKEIKNKMQEKFDSILGINLQEIIKHIEDEEISTNGKLITIYFNDEESSKNLLALFKAIKMKEELFKLVEELVDSLK